MSVVEMTTIFREYFTMCCVQEAGDTLELGLEAGRVRVRLVMGDQEKQVRVMMMMMMMMMMVMVCIY